MKYRKNNGGFVCSYVKQIILLVFIKLPFGFQTIIQNQIAKFANNGGHQ